MRCAMGIASVVVLKESSFRRRLGAVCQCERLSCRDPAGSPRCVVFTGRLRAFKKEARKCKDFVVWVYLAMPKV